MWELILILLTLVFISAIIIQIVYIRVNLSHYKKENAVSLMPLEDKSGTKNIIRSYGLVLNLQYTGLLKKIIKMNHITVSVPDNTLAICNKNIESKNIVYTNFMAFVLEKNAGCYNLVNDILSGKTKYLLDEAGMLIVHFDNELTEKMKDSMRGNRQVDNNRLNAQEIIICLPLDNSYAFKEREDAASCSKLPITQFSYIKTDSVNKPNASYFTKLDVSKNVNFSVPIITLGFNTI